LNKEQLRTKLAKYGLNNTQIEDFLNAYRSLNYENLESIYQIFTKYSHPNESQINQYEVNRINKLNNYINIV